MTHPTNTPKRSTHRPEVRLTEHARKALERAAKKQGLTLHQALSAVCQDRLGKLIAGDR